MQREVVTIARARSRSSDAYSMLRGDIVNGRLMPGSRLVIDDIRRNYGVSLSPVREALMRLASEGLVVSEEMKGFRVAPASLDDLLDVTRMRKELEGLGIRLSIERGGTSWEAGIIAARHELITHRKIGADGLINPDWEQRHGRFHSALVAACGSPWLLHFRNVLYDQSDRYRKLSVRYLHMPRDDVGEHQALADAVLARDVDAAIERIHAHFDRTMEIVMAAHPEFADAPSIRNAGAHANGLSGNAVKDMSKQVR